MDPRPNETDSAEHKGIRTPTRFCRTPEDFEEVAAEWMVYWGFSDARKTPKGVDGGIDIDSAKAVAQVKAWMVPIGRPEVQQLRGVAYDGRVPIFFSLMAYTNEAIQFAADSGVALFRFVGYDGTIQPVNPQASALFAKPDPEASGHQSKGLYAAVLQIVEELSNAPGLAAIISLHKPLEYYVQFSCEETFLYAECTSNHYLIGPSTLSPQREQRLKELGWNPPGLTNFWREWSRPVDARKVAETVTQTLYEVYGGRSFNFEIEKLQIPHSLRS